jgi:hypothetical protein
MTEKSAPAENDNNFPQAFLTGIAATQPSDPGFFASL